MSKCPNSRHLVRCFSTLPLDCWAAPEISTFKEAFTSLKWQIVVQSNVSVRRKENIFAITISGSSAGKESICDAGDPGLICGPGRSTGEGMVYPLQYSWASLVTQTVKNPPAMWEAWILFLGWEDPLESEMATHSSILAWRIPKDRGAWWATVHGVAKSWTWLSN